MVIEDRIREKLLRNKEAVMVSKIAYDRLHIQADFPIDEELDETFLVEDILKAWIGDDNCGGLDYEVDEETDEFSDYTGFCRLHFRHPSIYKFFTLVNELEENVKEDYLYNFDSIHWKLQGQCFTGNNFNTFEYDENGVIREFVYIYDAFSNAPYFLSTLIDIIEMFERLIEEIKVEKEKGLKLAC